MPNRRLNPAALTGIYGAEEVAAPPELLWSLGALTPIGRRVRRDMAELLLSGDVAGDQLLASVISSAYCNNAAGAAQ